MVESSALLKRRTPKGYRGFESLPHRSILRSMYKATGRFHASILNHFQRPQQPILLNGVEVPRLDPFVL